jgi:hypothetical protein
MLKPDGQPEKVRKRGRSWLAMLLVPPLLLVCVATASIFRPLVVQVGPNVLLMGNCIGPWGVVQGSLFPSTEPPDEGGFVVTGQGKYFGLRSPSGGLAVAWFQGRAHY